LLRAVDGDIGGEHKQLQPGDTVRVPCGTAYRLRVSTGTLAGFVAVRATPYLEERLALRSANRRPLAKASASRSVIALAIRRRDGKSPHRPNLLRG
jgi:hypothetical protein